MLIIISLCNLIYLIRLSLASKSSDCISGTHQIILHREFYHLFKLKKSKVCHPVINLNSFSLHYLFVGETLNTMAHNLIECIMYVFYYYLSVFFTIAFVVKLSNYSSLSLSRIYHFLLLGLFTFHLKVHSFIYNYCWY